MDDKLTHKSQEALSDAVRRATAGGNPHVDPLHLLAALIEQSGGTAAPLLRAIGVDPATVLKGAADLLARMPQAAGTTVSAPDMSRPLLSALATAAKRARGLDDEYVSTEKLLHGLAPAGRQAGALPRAAAARRPLCCARRAPDRTCCSTLSRRCVATPVSPPRTRKAPTRRWRSTGST